MALFNVKDAVAKAKAQGPDMTQAKGGGGDYTPPAEGFVRLRFVGYFETGKRESTYKGQKKVGDTVELVFELSGPKHPARVLEDGTKVPLRITEKMSLSLNEKARLFKLFHEMNHDKSATHIAELLGNAYVAKIEHTKKQIGDKEVVFANLRDIKAPFVDIVDIESGETTKQPVNVDPPLTELKLFLWDFATPEMWDALFIPGEYDEKKNDKGEVTHPARSKNVIQQKIAEALNWKACPVFDYANAKLKGDTATAAAAAALDKAMEAGVTEVKQDADDLAGIA